MKVINLFAAVIVGLCLTACGGSDSITPAANKVNGPLGKFFEIVQRDYAIRDGEVSIEFKRIAEGGPTDASWSTHPTFIAELQDKSGNTISSESSDVVQTKEQLEAVFSLNVGETASVIFKFGETKGAAKVKVSSKWDESAKTEDYYTSRDEMVSGADYGADVMPAESDVSMESSASGSEDWDAILDSYDKYVTKYISFVKKAANGDIGAMAEYPGLLQQAEDFGDKLSGAKSNLTTEQWVRYMKITQKMSAAAAQMR